MLTPSSISACPGDDIVVKCSESDTAANIMKSLRWTIVPNSRQIAPVELTVSQVMNTSQRMDDGLPLFYSKLTSYSPLTSVLTTTAHPILNGATVTCQSTVSMDMLQIIVIETGKLIPSSSKACTILLISHIFRST